MRGFGMLQKLTNLFWLWTILGVAHAWFFPTHYTWFVDSSVRIPLPSGGEYAMGLTALGLGIIMLGMGVTLTFDDFHEVLRIPGSIGVGVGAQFVIMPLLGFSLAHLFALPPELKVGLILVSCCPGGTASNVITYLARANVPLSVLMTMSSTLVAVGLTPLLTKLYAGAILEVNAAAMFGSMVMIVLLPVLLGVVLNHLFASRLQVIQSVSPLISVLVIVLIVGGIVGKSKDAILEAGLALLGSVLLLHVGGFGLGYLLAKLLRLPVPFRRTLSIEVGMQNSGLGAQLAKAHFTLVTAAPCAISAVFHCLLGSFVAALWRTRAATPAEESSPAPKAALP